jgi:uncharacterized protein (UPF0332 family)
MTLHAHLLAQARSLATREPRRPKQATLRRAISSAYYALFHLLVSEASRRFAQEDELWQRLNRVYSHSKMNAVSKEFANGSWPKAFNPVKGKFPIPQELKDVAQAFVDLQQARQNADYDLTKRFSRDDALDLVEQAEQAFRDWALVRQTDLARIYLGCFLLWDEWDKVR